MQVNILLFILNKKYKGIFIPKINHPCVESLKLVVILYYYTRNKWKKEEFIINEEVRIHIGGRSIKLYAK
jgi:hypothetical protein